MLKTLTLVASFEKFPGLPPRSKERLKYERFMHYFHYPFIIHPYSRFRYYWDCLMCLSVFSHVVIATVNSDNFYHGKLSYHALILTFHLHGFIDIILNFFTGYPERTNKTVTLTPSKIVQNYLQTWFAVDALSIFPFESLSYFIVSDCFTQYYNEVLTCHFFADLFSFTFVLRIFCFQRYFNRIVLLKMISVFRAQAVIYSFWMIGIILAFVNANALVPYYYPNSSTWVGKPYNSCQPSRNNYEIVCRVFDYDPSLLLISALSFWEEKLHYFKNYETAGVILRICFYYFSAIGITAFVAFLINLAVCNKTTKERFYEKDRDVRSYLRKKPFTKAIRERVLLYFQVYFEKIAFEDELLEFLPESELDNITINSTLPVIQKVQLFIDLPKEILRKIASVTSNEIYLPHDVLVRTGDIGRSMFVIRFGTVAIYSKKFVKLTELDEYDSFGAKSIIFPVKILNASAIALKVSSVCRLDRNDFLAVMQFYPGYLDHLQRQLLAEKEMRS